MAAHPIGTVIGAWILSSLLYYFGTNPSLLKGLTLAEFLIISSAIAYHYFVITPETGAQNVMSLITSAVAVAFGLRTFIKLVPDLVAGILDTVL